MLSRLVPRYAVRADNPNKMTDEQFAALVEVIKRLGCLSAITVRRDAKPGHWVIVDGHHRYWAAQLAGLGELPVVVDHNHEDARAVGMGLNHIRGREDLQVVSAELREVTAQMGTDDAALLTGYTGDEIADLLAVVSTREDELPAAGADEPEELPKLAEHVLMLTFPSKADLQRAKRALSKAGDKDLGAGLLALIERKP